MSLPAKIINLLKDKHYRLNHLYYITDKDGRRVKFKFNPEQADYFENRHNRSLILKARQLGFTTEQCIIQLDAALFEGEKCAMIAHTKDDAGRLFREKTQYAYENLPEAIRKANPARNDRAGELVFTKGGSVAISTSFRGGTLKYLHVSEFGKICAKYPDKAREIVTGAFEAVPLNGYITLESTAEGRAGYFYDYCQTAEKLAMVGDELTALDFKFFFYAWWRNPEYSMAEKKEIPDRLARYFDELKGKHGIELTRGQKSWYVAKESQLGEDMWREYPSTPEEAFKQAVEGAYYKREFQHLYQNGYIGSLPKNPHQDVFTFWDLGVGDSMCIWFIRYVDNEFQVVGYYENSGEGMRHYFKILKDWGEKYGFRYGGHYAPHDINNRSMMADAKSRKEIAYEGYEIDGQVYSVSFREVPKLSVEDGIDAVREILPRCRFDTDGPGVSEGINRLENYRKEWDDAKGCWKDKPLHDWASHGSDAFRYFAVHSINRKEYTTDTKMRMAY